MSLITEEPKDLASTNELDRFSLQPLIESAEMRLGANVLMVMDNPPGLQETIDVVLRCRVVSKGEDQLAEDSDVTPYRRCKIVTARVYAKPLSPKEEEEQGSLFDEGEDEGSDANTYEGSGE